MRSKAPEINGIVFITGTDTGVGKTLLTAMLVAHLRDNGVNALAMKPFCSGGIEDLEVLSAMQGHSLSRRKLNPYYFAEPVAPLVGAQKRGQKIRLRDVLEKIADVKSQCDVLLIEGSGGLMVPLGEDFYVLDLIRSLKCPVIVVGCNRLGIINHALLTLHAMQHAGIKNFKIALMGVKTPDFSTRFNHSILEKLAGLAGITQLPFLAEGSTTERRAKNSFKKMKKTLARLLRFDSLHVRSLRVGSRREAVSRKNKKIC